MFSSMGNKHKSIICPLANSSTSLVGLWWKISSFSNTVVKFNQKYWLHKQITILVQEQYKYCYIWWPQIDFMPTLKFQHNQFDEFWTVKNSDFENLVRKYKYRYWHKYEFRYWHKYEFRYWHKYKYEYKNKYFYIW